MTGVLPVETRPKSVENMTPRSLGERHIALPGTSNFRDIGGYEAQEGRRIRYGRVYRSDTLSDLTPEAHSVLAEFDLYGLIDYRHEKERVRNPDRLPAGLGIRLSTPGFLLGQKPMLAAIADGQMTAAEIRDELNDHYRLYALENIEKYASTFEFLLASESRPVLLHCTSGKDRTGFGIALIMRALGCPDEIIFSDYLLTDRYRRDLSFLFPHPIAQDLLEALTAPQLRYLKTGLTTLEEAYGSNLKWISKVGLSQRDLIDLRRLLTEPIKSPS